MKQEVQIIITDDYQVRRFPNVTFTKENYSGIKNPIINKINETTYAVLLDMHNVFGVSTLKDLKMFGSVLRKTIQENLPNANIIIHNDSMYPLSSVQMQALKGLNVSSDERVRKLDEDIIREMTDEFYDEEDDDDDADDEEEEDSDDEELSSLDDFLSDIPTRSKPSKRKKKKNVSSIFKNAKKKKKSIKKINLVVVKKKKHIKRDKAILQKVIRELFPGNSKYMKKFRKVILKRWIKMYSISKSTLKKIEKDRKKKKRNMMDIPRRVINSFTNDIWNNPNR
nr:MAG TPA: Transcription factor SPT20, Protein SPT3, Transcription, Histone acetyltransferase, Histone.3A [Caudoviricetes sp.]